MPEPYSPYWLKARAPWNPSPAELADLVIDAFHHRHGSARTPEFDAGTFSLRTSDGSIVFLEPHYRAYCDADGDARDAVLEQTVSALAPLDLPTTRAQALTRIFPKLWSRDAEDRQRRDLALLGLPTSAVATRPWHGLLLQALVIDGQHTMTPVTEAMLQAWNLTFDAAFPRAQQNLTDRTQQGAWTEESPGLFRLTAEDGYDAARLFVPQALGLPSDEVLSVAPTRDLLFWCRKDDHAAARAMFEACAEALESDRRALSPVLLTAPSKGWKPHDLPRKHPAFEALRDMTLRWLAAAYDRQRERLVTENERAGREEPWVARFAVYKERSTGRKVSCATLTKGVVTLLPRTDWLSFADPDAGTTTITTWDGGVKALGGQKALQPFDASPPRYLINTYPSDAALAKAPKV